jgi:hypothetical protein
MSPTWSCIKLSQFVALFAAFCISHTPPLSQESTAPQASSQERQLSRGNLTVRISPKGKTFHPGDTLKLRVVLSNNGNDTIFIRKEIEMSGCAKGSVRIFSLKGTAFPGPGYGCAADCWPLREDSKRPPIAITVVGDWVPLAPGYLYSREIESYPLGKPGRYLIGGDYSSFGLGGNCGWNYPEGEMAKLPYPLWTGQVETNSIWIEVTKR